MALPPKADPSPLRDALDEIRRLADEMQQRSSFRVTFEDWHIMPPDEILDWQGVVREESGDASYALPAELVEIYGLTGGFSFRWECQADGGLTIRGAVDLVSLPELHQRDDEEDTPMKECLASWRPFDRISPDKFTALRLDGGAAGLQCVYFTGTSPVPMDMSPTQYIVAAAANIGIIGWQTKDVTKSRKIVRELVEW